MSRGALQKSVESTVSQFKDGVTANRNLLLKKMKFAMSTHDLKLDFPIPDFDAFQREFDNYIAGKVGAQATTSVSDGLLSFVASTAAGWAAEQLAAQIMTALIGEAVAGAAADAAIGGGATAGGAAVGGGAGWLGGPAGAAIGFGVGVTVGAIIDWWVTDGFKTHLTDQLTAYLNNLERDIVDGTKEKPDSGLRTMLHTTGDQLYLSQSEAIVTILGEGKR
jgi:hypothetical protein